MRDPRVAFVGFGEVNTPPDIIERKCREAREQLEALGIEVIQTAPVSDDPQGEDVARARAELAGKDFDAMVVCLAGWIPSHAVVGVIEPFRHRPMLLWGLSGWTEGERFITTADQAGTTALRKPMQDMGYTFKYVVNYRGVPPDMNKIGAFISAARAAAMLRDARIGMMGYRDMRLYATLHDGVSLKSTIGPDVEVFEMLEISQIIEALDPGEVTAAMELVKKRWTFTKPAAKETIEKTVKLALGVRQKILQRGYEAVSLMDVDGVKELMRFAPAGAFTLLHELEDVCTIPENDVMGAVTQLMTRYVTGQVAPYLEFYEFMEKGMLMGVPDYVPVQVVDGPVTVTPTAFGEFGEGLLNVSKVKTGLVTLARLTYTGDKYAMHMTTGEASSPSAWEEAGWTPPAPQLPGVEVTLDGDVDGFVQKVMGQHYILSYGDNVEALTDLCNILGVEVL